MTKCCYMYYVYCKCILRDCSIRGFYLRWVNVSHVMCKLFISFAFFYWTSVFLTRESEFWNTYACQLHLVLGWAWKKFKKMSWGFSVLFYILLLPTCMQSVYTPDSIASCVFRYIYILDRSDGYRYIAKKNRIVSLSL